MIEEIIIPGGKSLIGKNRLKSPKIIGPGGENLSIYAPKTENELRKAWQALIDYTRRIAPNPESALQDPDKIEDIIEYHFGKKSDVVFTVIDERETPVAIAHTEITDVSYTSKERSNGELVGFIYQIGHNPLISKKDTDFSVITKLYIQLTDLLQDISICGKNKWLGIITESRKEGRELGAITKAGYKELVPNESYKPPAVQSKEIKDKDKNLTTKNLVLMSKNVPNITELKFDAAESYLKHAYCKGQNLKPTLKLIHDYFFKKQSL